MSTTKLPVAPFLTNMTLGQMHAVQVQPMVEEPQLELKPILETGEGLLLECPSLLAARSPWTCAELA